MSGVMRATRNSTLGRRVAGAILLDLAVSPLFIWNVFAQPLAQELDASATQVSLVFSFGLAAFSIGVVAGGRLADTCPPRQLALVCAIGMFIGLGLSAVAPSLWLIALSFGLLQGFAAGLGYATAVHEAGLINRGLIMALVVSAYGAGSAALAPLASWWLEHYGRASTFAVLAGLAVAVCGLAAALLPGHPPHVSGHIPNKPEEPANSTKEGQPEQRRLIVMLWLVFGLASAPGLAAFAIAGELTGGAAYGAVAAVSLGNMGGRLIAGPMADRFGIPGVLHGFFVLLIAACVLFVSTEQLWLLQAGLLAVGAQYGALSTLTPLATRAGVPVQHFGRAFGLVFSAWGIVGLAAPAASAALMHSGGRLFVAAAMLTCALAAWRVTVIMLRLLPKQG